MSFFGDLRDAREMERIARQADLDGAGKDLETILGRHPLDPRAATLLALSRSERGELQEALEAADLAGRGLAPAAALILKAEVLLDSARRMEARNSLEEARALDPTNIVAPGLLRLLDLEERGMRDARSEVPRLPPGALWCGPILSRLVLALEEALERLPKEEAAARGIHGARAVLFRPRLETEKFHRSRQHRGILPLERAFVEERFAEIEKLHREWIEEGGDPADPYPAALRAYALLAGDRAARALEALSVPLKDGKPIAELLHLAAIAELKLGRRPRAAGRLRRAAAADDIAMVSLAREEAGILDGGVSRRSTVDS